MYFWLQKFQQNIARDRLVTRTLRKAGWQVVRIWECQLARKHQARVLRRLKAALVSRSGEPGGASSARGTDFL